MNVLNMHFIVEFLVMIVIVNMVEKRLKVLLIKIKTYCINIICKQWIINYNIFITFKY